MSQLVLDGNGLTFEQVLAIAEGRPGDPEVLLSAAAFAAVEQGAAVVKALVDDRTVAYGVTTGFGAFKNILIDHDDVETLQRNLILSHAVGVGDPFDRATTRAIMVIRANTLARGYSGIQVATLQFLLDLINRGVHPVIPSKGSLGASGDLAPLAHMALVLLGEGYAEFNGEILDGAEALRRAGLAPVSLYAKEGLALINGTTVMCALGTLQTERAELLSRTADIAGCLSLEALNGTALAFDDRIHQLRPFPRQIDCANYLRQVLEGSGFTRPYDPTNIQDAYSLRCMPQVHGAVRDVIAYSRWAFEIELNSVTDNPLIFVDDAGTTVLSGGNFHGEPLALALDYLSLGMTDLGNMSERRTMRLTDASSNGNTLPAFLTAHGGLNSGYMAAQYTAAALASENKILAHPASADTIPTSANVEDHVSMGLTAALKARQVLDNIERILAIELLAAAQGIDFRKQKLGSDTRLGKGTQPVYDLIRTRVPFSDHDVVLAPLIEAVRRLIASRELFAAAAIEPERLPHST